MLFQKPALHSMFILALSKRSLCIYVSGRLFVFCLVRSRAVLRLVPRRIMAVVMMMDLGGLNLIWRTHHIDDTGEIYGETKRHTVI